MIKAENHNREAINTVRNNHFKGKDPQLVEKILKALSLLELIAQEGSPFVFKGGTCLLLLLDNPRRFSIDLDIIVPNKNEFILALENICKNSSMFTRIEEDVRVESKVPKAHYKIFYISDVHTKEAYVLVDLIEDRSPYPEIQDSTINPSYFKTEGPYVTVKTPSIDSILGDKLTAFAPRTAGIRLNCGKDMEIAKQLFDVASLFDNAKDISHVHSSFIATAKKEIKYRGLSISPEDVLNDAFDAALTIALRGKLNEEMYKELQGGTNKLKGYIFDHFSDREVHVCAAKVAVLTQMLLRKQYDLTRYAKHDIATIEIKETTYNTLNKIKKISPEAFWYWNQAISLKLN